MRKNGPGKAHRDGISLIQLQKMFPNNEVAERWFVEQRWPDGVTCPKCESKNIHESPTRKPQPYRCRDCRKLFSVKTDTLMHSSPLTLQQWAIAYYQMSTSLKGTSSMKMHRDLGITQKSAWHVGHRIREMYANANKLQSPVEADECYIGGKEMNKHESKRLKQGSGYIGKQPIVGMKSRETNTVKAVTINTVSSITLSRTIRDNVEEGATVYTDQLSGYRRITKEGYKHQSVNHAAKQYIDGQCHTNGIESFWALLKRGYHGTYHQMSFKHLPRYIAEFSGRFNNRDSHTIDQMGSMVRMADGKRLSYSDLISRT